METENVNLKNWKSLIKPSKIDVQMSDDLSKAKIIAEPLEKGYGLTLGNSLRRILLSSIRGAAVTSIQIDGVLHEFTSIKGVREDVTDIVLNVKSLALKSSSEGTKKLILDAKGPGEIKASDITPVTDVEILNPRACKALKAVSLPEPGPFTSTDKVFIPYSNAFDAAESAAI